MLRVIDITRVVIKYRLDEYLARFSQAKFLNVSGKITRKLFNVKQVDGTFPVRVKLALEELGPVFVKFGQILSTRPDALPESLIKELKKHNLIQHVGYSTAKLKTSHSQPINVWKSKI